MYVGIETIIDNVLFFPTILQSNVCLKPNESMSISNVMILLHRKEIFSVLIKQNFGKRRGTQAST